MENVNDTKVTNKLQSKSFIDKFNDDMKYIWSVFKEVKYALIKIGMIF